LFRDSQNISNRSNFNIVENLGAKEFKNKLYTTKDAILLDVRTEMENRTSRIPNSLLIDIADPLFLQKVDNLDRKKHYFLYCRSGNRSFVAGNQMLRMGFETVYNLQQGIIGWKGETEQNVI